MLYTNPNAMFFNIIIKIRNRGRRRMGTIIYKHASKERVKYNYRDEIFLVN